MRVISGGRATKAASVVSSDAELEALWSTFWADRDRREVRTRLARSYEYVIDTVISGLGLRFRSHWDPAELHSIGYIGLLESIDRFQPDSEVARFPGYARHRVKGAILDELRRLDWFPRDVRHDISRVRSAREELTARGREDSSDALAAKEAGLSERQSARVLAAMQSLYFLQLDQRASRGPDLTLAETIAASDEDPLANVLERADQVQLRAAILDLPARECAVISFRYLGELKHAQIAGMLGVTRSRVCQIEAQAIEHLRAKLSSSRSRLELSA